MVLEDEDGLYVYRNLQIKDINTFNEISTIHHMFCSDPRNLNVTLDTIRIGSTTVTRIKGTPVGALRTKELIAKHPAGLRIEFNIKCDHTTVRQDGKAIEVPVGAAILFDMDDPHIIDVRSKEWVVLDVSFDRNVLSDRGIDLSRDMPILLMTTYFTKSVVKFLNSLFEAGLRDQMGMSYLRRAVEDLLVAMIMEASGSRQRVRVPGDVVYYKAVRYINERYIDPELTPEQIAASLNISVRQLYRLFKERETSVKTTIENQRMRLAATILSGDDHRIAPVAEIATIVGYRREESFRRTFKKTFGVSPQQFRKRVRKKAR